MFRFLFRFLFKLVLAVAAAALTVLVIIYWLPDLQKSLLKHFLEKDIRRSYQVEHFQVRHNGIEIDGVFVLDGGNGLQLDALKLEGNVLRSVLRRKLTFDGGYVEGLFIDLSLLRQGEMIDLNDYLRSSSQTTRENWLGTQLQRVLAVIPQNNWQYEIRNVPVEGSLLMEDFYLEFDLLIEEATADGANLRLIKFELH